MPLRSAATAGLALPAASIPFRQFHGDALRSGKKDHLSVMEVHDLVPELDALGFQPCHHGLATEIFLRFARDRLFSSVRWVRSLDDREVRSHKLCCIGCQTP